MALTAQYLITARSVPDLLAAIQNAKAPERFTQTFLENLGFKSTNDRLYIGVLKALRFLDDTGRPTPRYFEFLDQTQGPTILAEAIREAYADLFDINVNAQNMTKGEFLGKIKTLSQGKLSDNVAQWMWLTFSALTKQADFAARPHLTQAEGHIAKPASEPQGSDVAEQQDFAVTLQTRNERRRSRTTGLELVYNIQLHLPETRDPAVYDALFRSLKEHIL